MYRPYKLLLACPWMNRQDLKCNVCPYRDPPQLDGTGYMRSNETWWSAFLDTKWQADECVCMGGKECFEAIVPWLKRNPTWTKFLQETGYMTSTSSTGSPAL